MYTLPELDYPFAALEPYIDATTMEIHYGKHHQTYVNNLNDALSGYPDLQKSRVEDLLKNIASVPSEIRTKVINNGGGHYNHNLYWKFLSPTKSAPEGKLLKELDRTFGSVDTFREKFSTTALTYFGSGWGWLVVNNRNLEILSTPNQNSPISDGKIPILGIDVWEHAYYLKYQNRRADYIQAFFNVINWGYVSKLFEKNK